MNPTVPVVMKSVSVSDPAHPSHRDWLSILLKVLTAATAIGPAVVAVVDPKDAELANKLGGIAGVVITTASDPAPSVT